MSLGQFKGGQKLYQVNDYVVYGNEGVCKVEAMEKLDITGVDAEKLYYALQPLYRNGRVYTPVDTKIFMRPVISKEIADELIDQIPHIQAETGGPTNASLLKEKYTTVLQSNDCEDLIQLIISVYEKGRIAETKNKKMGQTDKFFMRKAEELLYGEFAVALDIPRNQVHAYIEQRIDSISKIS